MGSRVMHYCISTILNEKLQINDNQFLLGGLAPDAYKEKGKLKEISHYMRKDDDGVGYIDYYSFCNKYLIRSRTPFNLGYYFHLISDDIWLKEIYYKKIKWLAQDIKTEAKNMYYRDFWRLNGRLIDYYSLELVCLKEQLIDIDKNDYRLLHQLTNDLETDFNMADTAKEEPLEIIEFTEAIQTIEKTVEYCMENFENIQILYRSE